LVSIATMHERISLHAPARPDHRERLVAWQRSTLRREAAGLAGLVLAAIIPLAAAALLVPSVSYTPDPRARLADGPEQAVIRLLHAGDFLPSAEARIAAEGSAGSGGAFGVSVTQVRARSAHTLLRSMLEAAPTITAEVDAVVARNGCRVKLTFTLSQYGLLLPGMPPDFHGPWSVAGVVLRGERSNAQCPAPLYLRRPAAARDASSTPAITTPAAAPAINAPTVPSSGLTSPSTCCAIRTPT
jgi:hypothetical protein